jgi:pimeloyl-ACP methyl ester carboxylesterase
MLFDRRSLMVGAAFCLPFRLVSSPANAEDALLFLDPSKLAEWRSKIKGQSFFGSGGKVDYADENPMNSERIILSFHGTSAPYRISMPLEYPLLEAGYRVIMPNRPSYGGTKEDWGTSATAIADMANELLKHKNIRDPVVVMGTSAGGPGALAFASKYPSATRALILNSAVTHTWTDAKYVPLAGGIREKFRNVFEMKELYKAIAEAVFLFGVPDFDFDKNVIGQGKNLDEAKKDIAHEPVKNMFINKDLLTETKDGVVNDYLNLYLADDEFVQDWNKIKAPTLLTHCERDIVVPTEHSLFVREKLADNSKLLTFERVAGHITCLGGDAKAMHDRVRDFINSHS